MRCTYQPMLFLKISKNAVTNLVLELKPESIFRWRFLNSKKINITQPYCIVLEIFVREKMPIYTKKRFSNICCSNKVFKCTKKSVILWTFQKTRHSLLTKCIWRGLITKKLKFSPKGLVQQLSILSISLSGCFLSQIYAYF